MAEDGPSHPPGRVPRSQGLIEVDAEQREDSALEDPQQVEEPHAEGDTGIDEVGESQHEEVDAEHDLDLVPEDQMLDLPHHGGNEGEVVVQYVGAVDQEAEDEAGPHDRIAEERLDDRVPSAVVLEHGQGHLGQGERQALVLHPLAPQNHQGAQQHEVV